MKRTLIMLGLTLALLLSFAVAPAATSTAHAQPARGGLLQNIDVTGVLEEGGTFEGVLSVTNLALVDGVLTATGNLTGTATDAFGEVTEIVNQVFEVTADFLGQGNNGQGGQCQILFLDLGPIFLDLLGLEVDLSQIVLDITAVQGPGRLLGNLLCALVGLLDGGPLAGINNLLNRINNLLG
ncbi:MAG: hypothetical protein KF893_09745 [Caldilineaceae bacterium]|nr:hypothetical protein [Caldilineaceae bacterium]